jgi:pyrimidine operon attenuation protein/uracil phosphoribosyltransferase
MTDARAGKQGLAEKRELLDAIGLSRALTRMTNDILGAGLDPKKLVLVGIRSRGVPLAERLRATLREKVGFEVPLGVMDITLYRDDLLKGDSRPVIGTTDIPCAVEGRAIVLVDDVLYTGRTTRAALAELMDFGRPEVVRLAVLVDRGHRELPIQPDFVGLREATSRSESVLVMLRELDGVDRVVVYEKKA